MEQEVNAWKTNLTNGLIMGLVGIVYTLIIYFLDLTFNKYQGYVGMVIQLGVLFFLLKSYRDNFRHGQITYGQSVGAGVIIYLYYAVLQAIFIYLLYAIIDPALVKKSLAFAEETMLKKGVPQAAMDAGMAIQAKLMKPAIMAPLSLFGSMIGGTIISLLVSIFVKKEGNPLIDAPQN
ncbi:MAG: DUF4199 domain-containing protein [Bacteroidia bacterium]|nr:DUF4199 domain-containing protein [Bacteroidia bacterium]